MTLKERRILMIQDIIENGRIHTWLDYADKYGFKDGRQANDYYRYYEKTGNIVPNIKNTNTLDKTDTVEIGEDEEVMDYNLPEGAIITGGWSRNAKGSFRFKMPEEDIDKEDRIIETLKEYSPKVLKSPEKKNASYAVLLSIPDLHYGKGPLEETSILFRGAVAELLSRYDHSQIDKFIVPLGNDILNSEGNTRATTKGTPQWDSAEPWDTFNKALEDCIDVVSHLSTIAPVEVVCVHGNHDRMSSYYLFRSLEGYLQNNENVIIHNDVEARNYIEYGNTAFLIDHGELKPADYPQVFAAEEPQLWGRCKYKEAILGHKHHQDTKEFRGFIVRYLPALCGNDKWHRDMAYTKSHRAAQAFNYSKEGGFIGMQETRVELV